jgi:hypothetical protein
MVHFVNVVVNISEIQALVIFLNIVHHAQKMRGSTIGKPRPLRTTTAALNAQSSAAGGCGKHCVQFAKPLE